MNVERRAAVRPGHDVAGRERSAAGRGEPEQDPLSRHRAALRIACGHGDGRLRAAVPRDNVRRGGHGQRQPELRRPGQGRWGVVLDRAPAPASPGADSAAAATASRRMNDVVVHDASSSDPPKLPKVIADAAGRDDVVAGLVAAEERHVGDRREQDGAAPQRQQRRLVLGRVAARARSRAVAWPVGGHGERHAPSRTGTARRRPAARCGRRSGGRSTR